MEFQYIGDGLYMKIHGDTFVVVASDGVEATDKVVFDKITWENLLAALRKFGWTEDPPQEADGLCPHNARRIDCTHCDHMEDMAFDAARERGRI